MSPAVAPEPYLARGVLCCRDCQRPMDPAVWRGTRFYRCAGCADGAGRRVDAQLVESELWDRLVGRHPGLVAVTGEQARHRAVVRHVARVEVAGPYPMRVSWHATAYRPLRAVS